MRELGVQSNSAFEQFAGVGVQLLVRAWTKIAGMFLSALWLSLVLLFALDSTGWEGPNSCCASPYAAEDPSPTPSECGCAQLQSVTHTWRREGDEVARFPAEAPDWRWVRIVDCLLPSQSHQPGGVILFSQRWQFVLRAAVAPRAPTSFSPAVA